MDPPEEGQSVAVERTFTAEDVRRFASVSRDTQARHTDPDEDGRLLVHGLLTATLPTETGGDFEVLAREMTFEFLRPVYTGEPITCTSTFESVEERADRYDLEIDAVCENGDGDVVLRAAIDGLVWKDDSRDGAG